jgi:hypothetical protein
LIWRKIKNISGNKTYRSIPTLYKQNNAYVSDKEKADLFVDSFAEVCSDGNRSPEFSSKMNTDCEDYTHDRYYEHSNMGFQEPSNDDFNMAELQYAIDTANDTTPGKDGISYNMLKHLGPTGEVCLLQVINTSWLEGICPPAWREAVLCPILKPGKDPSSPLSYRPIALTPVTCKLMERMINNRLKWFFEKYDLFSPFQSGFRKGRRTVDHLVRLETDINKGICVGERTLAIFLDIEKAYDMVWKKGIIIKLSKLGVGLEVEL